MSDIESTPADDGRDERHKTRMVRKKEVVDAVQAELGPVRSEYDRLMNEAAKRLSASQTRCRWRCSSGRR